ncbi:MAG: hypothetical protein ACXWTK_07250 [Methylobacter sp.]
MSYVIQSRGANPGTPNIELQRFDTNTIAEKRQLRQTLQTILMAVDRLEVSPRQRGNKFNALWAITSLLEGEL